MLLCPPTWDVNTSNSSGCKSKVQLLIGVNQLSPVLCPNPTDVYSVQLGRGGKTEGKLRFGASLGTHILGLGTRDHPPLRDGWILPRLYTASTIGAE